MPTGLAFPARNFTMGWQILILLGTIVNLDETVARKKIV